MREVYFFGGYIWIYFQEAGSIVRAKNTSNKIEDKDSNYLNQQFR